MLPALLAGGSLLLSGGMAIANIAQNKKDRKNAYKAEMHDYATRYRQALRALQTRSHNDFLSAVDARIKMDLATYDVRMQDRQSNILLKRIASEVDSSVKQANLKGIANEISKNVNASLSVLSENARGVKTNINYKSEEAVINTLNKEEENTLWTDIANEAREKRIDIISHETEAGLQDVIFQDRSLEYIAIDEAPKYKKPSFLQTLSSGIEGYQGRVGGVDFSSVGYKPMYSLKSIGKNIGRKLFSRFDSRDAFSVLDRKG